MQRMKYWEITADNLSKAGWSWGCVSGVPAKKSVETTAANAQISGLTDWTGFS
jgi:hypothetical protein